MLRTCLVALLFASLVCGECPTGWFISGQFCYHFHDITYSTSGMNWNDSRLACQRYGGDLIVIRNSSEQQFIASKMTAARRRQHYWIGLTDAANESNFVWIDGTPLAATGSHWKVATGEPNNWGGNEDCAELHDTGLWNDNQCSREFGFICQKRKDTPIPPAPTLPPRPSETEKCKLTALGTMYRGSTSTTMSGFTCQRWDSQTPHKHKENKPEDHPNLVNNYCRNPDQEPRGPWCYTTNPRKRWDYCDIKMCNSGPLLCEAGWHGFNNSCYLFQKEGKTWSQGRAECQMRGGDLVIVDSQGEHNFLTNFIKRENKGYWIGLTDKNTEGKFFWVDGSQLNDSVAFWGSNEPSNAFGGEDCVEMWTWWNTGRWNDNRCAINRNFICEKVAGKSMCPEDWVTYKDMCYQVNAHPEQKKTWLQARSACMAYDDANLVSIHDVVTVRLLTQEFQSVFTRTGFFWHGLNDINVEGKFEWTDKTTVQYKHWAPNEERKNNDNLDCVKSELRSTNGLWSLADCNSTSERNYYVCARKREYGRCHSPLGMEDFRIADSQITASSQKSQTTPASSGRRNAVKGFGLDGSWCAATNDKNQWLRIDLGEYYTVSFIGIQGHTSTSAYVKTFFLKYSPDGIRWSVYGYNPPTEPYKVLQGNTPSDKNNGASVELTPPVKATLVEIHPLDWFGSICMRVEVYGCPAVAESSCGRGWLKNETLNACYKVGLTPLPWEVARSNCMLENGDLLSVTSILETSFVYNLLIPQQPRVYAFWIGLNNRATDGMFSWSDGSALTIALWITGNPVVYDRRFRRMFPRGIGPYSRRKYMYTDSSDRSSILLAGSCVGLRPYYNSWFNTDCASRKPYICKKRLYSAKIPKDKYTGRWVSLVDYYWPLSDVENGTIAGSRMGFASGTFTAQSVSLYQGIKRQALAFDGQTSIVIIKGFEQTCVSDPSRCANGMTVMMLLNLDRTMSSTSGRRYLLDIMGPGNNDAAGFYAYVDDGRLGVYLRSTHHAWHSIITPSLGNWFHFAFIWNEASGLSLFLNGQKVVTDNAGTRTGSVTVDRIFDLRIGKAFGVSAPGLAKFKIMSLAINKESSSPDLIEKVYNQEMGGCAAGWIPFGDHCYEFNTNARRFSNARLDCELRGAGLAIAHTSLQQAFLSMSVGPFGVNKDSYISLNARVQRRVFEWGNGQPALFSYWTRGRPNTVSWLKKECAVLKSADFGSWTDVGCYYSNGFVCQRSKGFPNATTTTGTKSLVSSRYSLAAYGCPLGTKLKILSAVFGNLPSCPYRDMSAKVESLCADRRRYCSFYVRALHFNHSCSSSRLELRTTYTCINDTDFNDESGCDNSWSSHHGSSYCYKLNQHKKTWANASAYCKARGAELVSIHSRYDNLYMTSLLIDSFELGSFWTGLNDLKLRGNYEWSDGSPVKYTNWYNGQPDDATRRGSCVKATLNQGYRGFVSWSDDTCSTLNQFVCKKLKASATTPKPLVTQVTNNTCLPGWFQYRDSCYQFSSSNATWADARVICNRQSAILATINSIDENEAVFNFLVNSSLDSAWIGLQDMAVFKGQQWVDGSPVKFVRWDSGQPDSNMGQQACTVMASNGFWRDNNCHSRHNYICKANVGKAKYVSTMKPFTLPVTPTANLKYCPSGWVWSPSTRNCYYFSNRTHFETWTMARSFCRGQGGDLTSIDSSTEQAYLEPFILTFLQKNAWVGLSDLDSESGWVWSNGKPAVYFNWDAGQPDDWHQMEDCVIMTRSGKWSDMNCGDTRSFICERSNNTAVNPPTVAPTAGPVKGYCEAGWLHYRNKCYKIVNDESLPWQGARNACIAEDVAGKSGDLVSIHSSLENAFLFSQMKGMHSKLSIGFNDIQSEGRFRWSDQSNPDYTNWYARQPDNYWAGEDCTEMWPFSVHKGKWNDVPCDIGRGYICQKDASAVKQPTPTPSKNSCPAGYSLYGGNCYSFKKQLMTWDEAAAFCRKEDASSDLLSIHNPYESAYVLSHMGEYTNRLWIGLHRPQNETVFRWSDSQPLDYTEWSTYPARRMLHLRSCVHSLYNSRNAGFWVDSNCTAKFPFVCKITKADREVVPEHPGTCPKNWIKRDKYCYLIKNSYYGTRSWPEARQQCLNEGADLASIHSAGEQIFLYEAASKGRKNCWIGLNDRQREKHMVWSDKTPLDFDNWEGREPNDNAGAENCIEMLYLSGKWNDQRCSSYHGYICKKEIGCDAALGMESRNITDEQIIASSVLGSNFAPNARWNGGSAWCAGVNDQNQFIQVDLGEIKRVTRIGTQGFSRNYVLSFRLRYSDDGKSWNIYRIEGEDAILPANRASFTSNGVKLDTPVDARFLKIVPLTWKYAICMRLEFYGCNFVCMQPLGLESGKIRNFEMKASSSALAHEAYDARFRKPNGQGWCAKSQDADQWLQIQLSTAPMLVSKVATQGVMIGNKHCVVSLYQLSYSDDGKSWTPYKTLKGGIRIFSGNIYAETAVFHTLTQPFAARYVRFQPLSWRNQICLRVEVFGCPYECDKPLGIAANVVPDKAVTASSYLEKHAPSSGRLNNGSFNVGSWCAKENDLHQFIELDLGAESRITSIATQGFEGDVSKYVTDFWVQFSFDGKFWNLYQVSGVIQTLKGNSNGRDVSQVKLPSSIRARYIRLNPRHWKQGICMRVEVYGCALTPIVYPTDAPEPKKTVVKAKVRLTEEKFREEFRNKSSPVYKGMANRVETAIMQLYESDYSFKDGFFGVQLTSLEPGSVIAVFLVIFKTESSNATWPLKSAVSKGKIGDFVVDKNFLQLTEVEEGQKGKSKSYVKKEGLTSGGKAALIVIFVLMIIAIVVGGLIYYFRKRKGSSQFEHQSLDNFDNPSYSAAAERIGNLPAQN